MKTQFILPLTLTVLIMSSITQAAPMTNARHIRARSGNTTTTATASASASAAAAAATDDLPALIPTRTQPANSIPDINMTMEESIGDANGPLPAGTEQKGPWALELPHNITYTVKAASSSDGVTQASTAQVDTSYLRAELVANAYCKKVVPGNRWDCPHCQSSISDAKIEATFTTLLDDTNGYIITSSSQKTIFLVFRGTNSIRSAIVDLQFIKSTYPPVSNGAEVHTGFYNSYASVQNTVTTAMGKLFTQYPNYSVDISGHSLGAAQAVLAAMDLFQRFSHVTPSNTKIYTYGEPRVGNKEFAAYVKSTNIPKIRTIHASDVVPHLPPMSFGFLHSGTEYWIKDNTSKLTEICTAEFESDACANSVVPFLSILDHLNYYGINEGLCLN